MDAFQGDDDDGALSDSQPDVGAQNDTSNDEGGVFSEDDDNDVRVAARKFPNLKLWGMGKSMGKSMGKNDPFASPRTISSVTLPNQLQQLELITSQHVDY